MDTCLLIQLYVTRTHIFPILLGCNLHIAAKLRWTLEM